MKKLSATQERTILTALGTAATHINDGNDPNTALVKAAEHHDIPSGHVRLMVHAYNTARSGQQRASGNSVLEKSADFPLASASEVLERLYPGEVKTAAQQFHSEAIAPEYSLPPSFSDDVEMAEKTARHNAIDWKMCDPPAALPREGSERMKRAWAGVTAHKQAFENRRRELSESENHVVACFQKLANYFRMPGGIPFGSVKHAAELYHGQAGQAVMGQVLRHHPHLEKQAGDALITVDNNAAPFTLVQACITAGRDMLQKRAAYHEAGQAMEKHAEDTFRPFVAPRSRSCLEGLCSPEKTAGTKSAAGLGTVIGYDAAKKLIGGVAGSMSDPVPESTVENQVSDIASPDHETRLRDIQLQYTLQDMMANDPVISQHDPESVTTAFNELSQTAPNASQKPLQLRALLRKHLQQSAFDPFEAQQVADMEKTVAGFRNDAGKTNGVSVLTG